MDSMQASKTEKLNLPPKYNVLTPIPMGCRSIPACDSFLHLAPHQKMAKLICQTINRSEEYALFAHTEKERKTITTTVRFHFAAVTTMAAAATAAKEQMLQKNPLLLAIYVQYTRPVMKTKNVPEFKDANFTAERNPFRATKTNKESFQFCENRDRKHICGIITEIVVA